MRSRRIRWLALAVNVAGFLFAPTLAHAGPVVTAVATVAAYLGATVGTAIAIGEFVTFVVLPNIALSVFSKLTAPKAPSAPERQASVISMQLGESAREVIFGEAATAGQLLDAFNYGGQYGTDWETLVIAVGDHRCEALVGYYITDVFYPFTADGVQAGFNGQLSINWHDGQIGQPADVDLIANSGGRWTANDRAAGVAYVVVSYKADAPNANFPVWPQGRPAFLWRVKGARLYDPRKDSTVAGASGAHRWSNPATWEWSDNAYLCRYAYSRGIYAGDQVGDPTQLLIGRGLSATQAPPERVAAYANLCDELVTLKVGGSEKRYRVNGVVRATDAFIDIENVFATSMAGVIVQRDGGVEIEPGAAKAAVMTFTDADLPVGLPIRVEQFLSDADRVNTVTPRYVEPEQAWRDHAAPVRRSTADIITDGGTREKTLNLALVTSHTQAQRCGEIDRRLGRLERRVALSLGPRFAYVEDGDWVAWQSDRYFAGATVTFRVEAASLDQGYRSQLLLREIAAGAFSWDAAIDEGTPGAAPVDEAGGLPPLALVAVTIEATTLQGQDGSAQPAVRAAWATPVDVAVGDVRVEIRPGGGGSIAATLVGNPATGELITTNGVIPDALVEARVIPVAAADGRTVTASNWTAVMTSALVAGGVKTIGGRTVADVLAAADAAAAQGRALVQTAQEFFLRTLDERAALIAETFHDGEKVKRIVVDTTDSFEEDGASLLRRLQLIGIVVDGGNAFQFSDTTLKASPTETWAQYRSGISTSLAANAAAIITEQTARSSADSAFASSLSTLSTTVGGHTASITTLQTSVNGLTAQYTLVVNAGNNRASIQAYAGGSLSSIILSAGALGFTNGTSDVFPFSIVGGVVRASSFEADRVAANSIVTNSILGGAVTGISWDIQGSAGFLSNSPSVIFSMPHTTIVSGSGHAIDVNVHCGNGSGNVGAVFTVKRDGLTVDTSERFFEASFSQTHSFTVFDQPGAGGHTYTIEGYTTAGSGAALNPFTVSMLVTELKR